MRKRISTRFYAAGLALAATTALAYFLIPSQHVPEPAAVIDVADADDAPENLSATDIHSYPDTPEEIHQHPENAIVPLSEFDGMIVRDIDVRSCVRMPEPDVLLLLRTRKNAEFNARTWSEDLERLERNTAFKKVRRFDPVQVPGGLRLTLGIVENPVILSIQIKGTDEAITGQLTAAIRSVDGGHCDARRVEKDRGIILKQLDEYGYSDAGVTAYVNSISSHNQNLNGAVIDVDDEVNLIFIVRPGTCSRIRSFDIRHVQAFAAKEIAAQLTLKRDGPFCQDVLNADRARLLAFYRSKGYATVEVRVSSIDTGKSANVPDEARIQFIDASLDVNEGPQCVVGKVRFEGNRSMSSKELERIVRTAPGALLIDDTVEADQARIGDYYRARGRQNVSIQTTRSRVTNPQRLALASSVWDIKFRIDEGTKKLKLDFATDNAIHVDGIILGEKLVEPKPDVPRPASPPIPTKSAAMKSKDDQF